MLETWVQSLGQENPLEKEMAAHSRILAWDIPWTEEPGQAIVHGTTKSQTQLRDSTTTTKSKLHFNRNSWSLWNQRILSCYLFTVISYKYLFIRLHQVSWGMQILICGMWNVVPRPGIEPEPPALESKVLTTGLPGESQLCDVMSIIIWLVIFG